VRSGGSERLRKLGRPGEGGREIGSEPEGTYGGRSGEGREVRRKGGGSGVLVTPRSGGKSGEREVVRDGCREKGRVGI